MKNQINLHHLYVNKANGNIYDKDGNLVQQASVGSEQKVTDNNTTAQDNAQQSVQNNQQTETDQTNTNAQSQQTEATTKALPVTGEQSNAGLVTIIATILLAVGSLFTFKRFTNNK